MLLKDPIPTQNEFKTDASQPHDPSRTESRALRKTHLERLPPGETATAVIKALELKQPEQLSEYFEQSCDQQPNAAAVLHESACLTYHELDQRANQLAHLLIAQGIDEGKPVGILLNRSIETYVALLGILKAGGAFVPLDVSFPADRVAYIAEDAGLGCLLTTSDLREKTGDLPCPVLEFDMIASLLAMHPETRPCRKVAPETLCYIIYTSGTTGRPKGVAVSHANIINFLHAITPIYGVKSEDIVYQGMTIAFDFSIEEIWPTWIAGATLVAGPTDSRRLGHGLTEFLIEHRITVLCCVPTLLATIDSDVPTLRSLLVGGEACPADLVRRWYRAGRRMLNTYGPTETTVTATWCELFPDRPVTIGVPVPTYHAYILNDQLCPVGDGESGELCIGGPGVVIGYINRPELTQERFVANPIWQDCEFAPRLYRTGDLTRFTPSGEIEYLGRIDTQVKIRGYRIELGEIEQVIREDPAVENAVVNPLEANGVAQDLVAYLKLRGEGSVAVEELRNRLHAALRGRLPYYMVPSYIEVLDAFPLLAADKIDRKALPAPALPRLGANATTYTPPETPLECQLTKAWEQILGQERVSAESDFFLDLGGHSLAAAQVISRLRQDPSMQGLSIGDLYSNPSIRRLAQFITAATSTPAQAEPEILDKPAPQRSSNLRVLSAGIVQLILLSLVILLYSIPVVGISEMKDQIDFWTLLSLGCIQVAWLGIVSFVLPILSSLLMRKVQPGFYPLWGSTYLLWWFHRRLQALSPIGALTGTPLLPPYLRLLGAKIGDNCHFATGKFELPMFLEIGEGVSIGYGAKLQPFAIEGGWLRLAPIQICQDVFLGTNSIVQAGADIKRSACIGEQSLVPQNSIIPAHEYWAGSPSQRMTDIPAVLQAMSAQADDLSWPIPVLAGYMAGTLFITLIYAVALFPALFLVEGITEKFGLGWGLLSTLPAGLLFVITVCTIVLLVKRAVLFSVEPGIYPLRSWFGLRKWLSDQVLQMSLTLTNTLYATLYLIPFLRLLGARIGNWSEVSTVSHIDPDMLTIGDESFVADIVVIAPAIYYHGCVALAPSEIGRRSFAGNGALIPIATRIDSDSLIGVYSIPPTQEVKAGTSWLGSPAIFLPRRQESQSFADDLIYRPRASSIFWRLLIEIMRIILPSSIIMLVVLLDIEATAAILKSVSALELWLLMVPLSWGTGITATLIVALLKWLVIGRYQPRVEPLWSVFVRRSELITGLYEGVAVPSLIGMLAGTPWIALALRLFGAHIGRRVWLDTTYLTEFDLVHVGDDAAVGDTSSLQTHLFEDRVMKMSTVKIGSGSSIGSHSVVLYDAEVEADASLDSLSLVMKGETLPAGSHWRGIPARALEPSRATQTPDAASSEAPRKRDMVSL